MLVIPCANCQKYYNADDYQNCPHCGAPKAAQPAVAPAQPQTKKRGGLFGKKNKDKNVQPGVLTPPMLVPSKDFAWPPINNTSGANNMPANTVPQTPVTPTDATVGIFGVPNSGASNAVSNGAAGDSATVGIFADTSSRPVTNVASQTDFGEPVQQRAFSDAGGNGPLWDMSVNDNNDAASADVHTAKVFDEQPPVPFGGAAEQKTEQVPERKPLSIEEEVRKATASSDGKTVGYFSIGTPSAGNAEDTDDSKPAAPAAKVVPVVGWLVCVKGSHFGEHFALESGRNSIGRNSTNSVVLSRELSVSREKHAWLIYEPKKREFFISPGESSGLTYCNGDNVFQPLKLNALDVIELGDSSYVFMPLCGEQFTWDDYIKKSEQ